MWGTNAGPASNRASELQLVGIKLVQSWSVVVHAALAILEDSGLNRKVIVPCIACKMRA